MLPADGIVRAAARWLQLLGRGTLAEASEILRQDAAYSDLTDTQYNLGLEWLSKLGLLDDADETEQWSAGELPSVLFRAAIASEDPIWLEDADTLVRTSDDLPADALALVS